MKLSETFKIRGAISDDLPTIIKIYNTIIDEGGFTADLQPYAIESKKNWFLSLKKNSNIFVIDNQNTGVGYLYFSPWRDGRDALSKTAEISFYIDKKYRGQGLGNMVLSETLAIAKEKGFKHLLAILLDINETSLALLKKFGFKIAGHLPAIADLKSRTCGQYIMLKSIES